MLSYGSKILFRRKLFEDISPFTNASVFCFLLSSDEWSSHLPCITILRRASGSNTKSYFSCRIFQCRFNSRWKITLTGWVVSVFSIIIVFWWFVWLFKSGATSFHLLSTITVFLYIVQTMSRAGYSLLRSYFCWGFSPLLLSVFTSPICPFECGIKIRSLIMHSFPSIHHIALETCKPPTTIALRWIPLLQVLRCIHNSVVL